jgi:hypothetical protein
MAGQPYRLPRLAPVFGWASAVASFLLILVLVGDIFSAGGFMPIASNIRQQDELAAPRYQAVDDQVLAQPSVAGEVSEPLMEGAEDARSPEIPEEELFLEVAAEQATEPTPADESLTETKESEIFTADEEAKPESPEERAGVTASGETTIEALLDVSSESTKEVVEEEYKVFEAEQGADDPGVSTFISETIETESAQEQPPEMLLAEEQVAEQQAEQVEQPPNDVAEMLPAIEPSPVVTQAATEADLADDWAPESSKDLVLGAEVILALCALGTGLAWFYMRRRGG